MRFILYPFLLLLTACTTLTPPASNQDLAWPARLKQLQKINHWTVQGAAGIRTVDNAWSASLFWHQTADKYSLHLFGPLGVNRIQLAGDKNQVTLTMPSEPAKTAKNAEVLLQKQLGWHLPVNYLQYWIRGIPAPQTAAQLSWDTFHHVTQLKQGGWIINYADYSNIDGIDLPTRINLHNPQLQVRLVIRQWQL